MEKGLLWIVYVMNKGMSIALGCLLGIQNADILSVTAFAAYRGTAI
jgi:hypothetical protein